jgi:hypothetical protein
MLVLATPASAALPAGTWATVNACDQEQNAVGIRGRMPGAKRQRMYMHFEAQWWSAEQERFLPTGASSPWIRVGSGKVGRQAGFNFTIGEPPAGKEYVLRGFVRFQWRARKKGRWRVVRRASTFTTGGHKGVQLSQPEGYSDTFCVLKPAAPAA